MQNKRSTLTDKYDLPVIILPLVLLLILILGISVAPDKTSGIIEKLRDVLGNQFSAYYLVIGVAFILISLYLICSKYGNIRLGNIDKPEHSNISWYFMIFTATMAADILYYSLHEWIYYYNSNILDTDYLSEGQRVLWSQTYSLFHWGFTPWIFYILPSVAYAYMVHVKGNNKYKISEACKPTLHNSKLLSTVIDIVSILVLLLATSTTFSVATPLLSSALTEIVGVDNSTLMTIVVLLIIVVMYSLAVVLGIKWISRIATTCIILFITLIVLFLLGGNTRFIIENALSSIGNLIQNFIRMSTWTDPARLSDTDSSGFPQDWTVFYWSYWIAWSVATPFFIAKISKGRTIRNVIIGGTLSGVACTFLSFSVLGGQGLSEYIKGELNIDNEVPSDIIINVFKALPFPELSLLILVLAMAGFYISTFDAITYVVSAYSYKNLSNGEEPSRLSKIYWSLLFAILPCALLFYENTAYQLQGLSIIAAFPMSILMIIVIVSLFKNLKIFLRRSSEN